MSRSSPGSRMEPGVPARSRAGRTSGAAGLPGDRIAMGERQPLAEVGRPRFGVRELRGRPEGKRQLLAPSGICAPGKLRQELWKLEDALGMARDGAQ